MQKRDGCPEDCKRGMDVQKRDAEEGLMPRRGMQNRRGAEEGCTRGMDVQKRDAE